LVSGLARRPHSTMAFILPTAGREPAGSVLP
jgi:hypothetical protein